MNITESFLEDNISGSSYLISNVLPPLATLLRKQDRPFNAPGKCDETQQLHHKCHAMVRLHLLKLHPHCSSSSYKSSATSSTYYEASLSLQNTQILVQHLHNTRQIGSHLALQSVHVTRTRSIVNNMQQHAALWDQTFSVHNSLQIFGRATLLVTHPGFFLPV